MSFGINGSDKIQGPTYAGKTSGIIKTDNNNIEISFNTKGIPGEITPSGTDLRMISGQFAGIPDKYLAHAGYKIGEFKINIAFSSNDQQYNINYKNCPNLTDECIA